VLSRLRCLRHRSLLLRFWSQAPRRLSWEILCPLPALPPIRRMLRVLALLCLMLEYRSSTHLGRSPSRRSAVIFKASCLYDVSRRSSNSSSKQRNEPTEQSADSKEHDDASLGGNCIMRYVLALSTIKIIAMCEGGSKDSPDVAEHPREFITQLHPAMIPGSSNAAALLACLPCFLPQARLLGNRIAGCICLPFALVPDKELVAPRSRAIRPRLWSCEAELQLVAAIDPLLACWSWSLSASRSGSPSLGT
jgi:hypothetical protein